MSDERPAGPRQLDPEQAPAHPAFGPPDTRLRAAVATVVAAVPADALLLSGGVDSSVLAALDPATPAVTVGLAGASADLVAAGEVASYLQVEWHPVELSRSAALVRLEELIRLLNSYNLELLNHVPLYVGGRFAQSSGASTIRTGEFADELFRGYVHLYDYPTDRFRRQVHRRAEQYRPPSLPVFAALGLTGAYPYTADAVVAYAAMLRREDNVLDAVCTLDGDQHTAARGGPPGPRLRRWGKAALRRAASGLLPDRIAARPKQDLEYGSGLVRLEEDLAGLVTEAEIAAFEAGGRRFIDGHRAAHAGMYKLYRAAGLAPRAPSGPDERDCLGCGGAVRPSAGDHCATCGRYPASREP